jgi:trk system potassium uptake protein TrkA
VPKVISKVNRDEMIKMAEKLGLDCVVSTKSITSDIILRYTRALDDTMGSSIETLYRIMDDKVEALEFKVKDDSSLLNTPIKNLDIKQGMLIVGIIRPGKKAVIPSGDDIIMKGDRVIVLSYENRITRLSDILR